MYDRLWLIDYSSRLLHAIYIGLEHRPLNNSMGLHDVLIKSIWSLTSTIKDTRPKGSVQ